MGVWEGSQPRLSCRVQEEPVFLPLPVREEKVDLKVTDRLVEIYHKGGRLTTHNRFPDYMKNKYSTHPEDMPPAFHWASSIGKSTRQVIDRIFGSVSIKEQGYNPCLAILRLSRTYTDARLETACEIAISRGIKVPRYHHLKAILTANQDITYREQRETGTPPEDTSMGYLRGSDYYRKEGRQ